MTAVVDRLNGHRTWVTVEVKALKARRSTLPSQVTAFRGWWLGDRSHIETLETARDMALT